MNRPLVVSADEWQQARDELLVEEKRLTHALDALAARRRRLPMVRIEKNYEFEAPDHTTVPLRELFAGRRQLIVYHFMLEPNQDWTCGGCTSFTDNVGDLRHLNARDTSFVLTARAPQSQITSVKQRMGWTVPWYSSHGTDFNDDMGLDGAFGLSVFLRDNDGIFRSYFTTARGVDRLRLDLNLMDLTPFGRQEEWQDSPPGWPQGVGRGWKELLDQHVAS
jgi:predicted dithiol-disulfide oxidoreductase (DUF899 family)